MGRRIGLSEGEELDSWVRVEDSPTRVAISVETTVRVSFDIRKRKKKTDEVLRTSSCRARDVTGSGLRPDGYG
jgi:hypothetical protein